MPSESIKLVCFDIGGVLLRLCNGWSDALQRAGIDASVLNTDFQNDTQFKDALHQFERGEIEQIQFTQRTSELTGLNPDQILAILDAWLIEPYGGIDHLLDQLEIHNIQTACLSNTNLRHWNTLTCSQNPLFLPLHRFHFRFASPIIGHRKPDAAIYQHVQDETGYPPASILLFDDLPENILAAEQKGWHACRIDPQGDPMTQATAHLQHLRIFFRTHYS